MAAPRRAANHPRPPRNVGARFRGARAEPLPGHFPTAFGLPLLRESRLNHLGKLAFQWVYWHALLPGREIPGIGPAMPSAGKKRTPAHA
jgi:hypothetical protein